MAEPTPASVKTFSLPIALACVAVGAGLFALLVITGGFGSDSTGFRVGLDPRLTFLLTPAFAAPLMVYSVRAKRLRLWPAVGLVVGLTLTHGAAQQAAGMTYWSPAPSGAQRLTESRAEQQQRETHQAEFTAYARRTAIQAGLTGGALGSGVSLLLVAAALRQKTLNTAAVATVLLTLCAGFALTDIPFGPFSAHLPHNKPPLEWALRLFLPWQLGFGAAAAFMLSNRIEA